MIIDEKYIVMCPLSRYAYSGIIDYSHEGMFGHDPEYVFFGAWLRRKMGKKSIECEIIGADKLAKHSYIVYDKMIDRIRCGYHNFTYSSRYSSPCVPPNDDDHFKFYLMGDQFVNEAVEIARKSDKKNLLAVALPPERHDEITSAEKKLIHPGILDPDVVYPLKATHRNANSIEIISMAWLIHGPVFAKRWAQKLGLEKILIDIGKSKWCYQKHIASIYDILIETFGDKLHDGLIEMVANNKVDAASRAQTFFKFHNMFCSAIRPTDKIIEAYSIANTIQIDSSEKKNWRARCFGSTYFNVDHSNLASVISGYTPKMEWTHGHLAFLLENIAAIGATPDEFPIVHEIREYLWENRGKSFRASGCPYACVANITQYCKKPDWVFCDGPWICPHHNSIIGPFFARWVIKTGHFNFKRNGRFISGNIGRRFDAGICSELNSDAASEVVKKSLRQAEFYDVLGFLASAVEYITFEWPSFPVISKALETGISESLAIIDDLCRDGLGG